MIFRAPAEIAILCVSSIFPTVAHAMSLQDYEAMAPDAQGKYLADFVPKMKIDIAVNNAVLADAIWAYFTQDVPGKPFAQGVEDLTVQAMVVDKLATEGKADPTKTQIEGMITYVVKKHFASKL